MKIEDITTNKELLEFIQLELIRQTQTVKKIKIVLPEKWFFKFIKLIQFYIKNDSTEPYRDWEIENIEEFRVIINNYQTKVFRK